jgi:serine/threonine protein kinase
MGEVWRARHRATGLPAAVKVITASAAREKHALKDFEREVRAVASLDHPGVVTLLDTGTVDPDAELASGGRLVAGSPWLAMEFASKGSLDQGSPPTTWEALRALMLAVLDALAHAHARGVVHRDLKPGNILVCGPDDPRPGPKLSDFGISYDVETTAQSSVYRNVTGTLRYMAPEQIQARFRDYGPWTDLYATGCLTWRYLTGRVPHDHKDPAQLMRGRLNGIVPSLQTRMETPPGIVEWLDGMLAVDPRDRFRRAADAAFALRALPHTKATVRATTGPDAIEPLTVGDETRPTDPPTAERTTASEQRVFRRPRAPTPDHWQGSVPPPPPITLLGSGLALHQTRRIPVAGRERERDALWDALRAVQSGPARAVVLSGPAGIGKTRLMEWLAERGHETGACTAIRIDGGGIAAALSSQLRTGRLGGERLRGHLLDAGLPASLTAGVEAVLTGRADRRARRETAGTIVLRAADERPVLLCVDDAHRADEALGLAAWVLRTAPAARVLVLIAVRGEDLTGREKESRLIAAIEDGPCQRLALAPLPEAARIALVQSLLPMEAPTAALIELRSAGNPSVAVVVTHEAVRAGRVHRGPDGFRVETAEVGALPASLLAPWDQDVERFLTGRAEADRDALEIAAAIGAEVPEDLWHEAADALAGVPVGRHGANRVVLSADGLRARRTLRDDLAAAGMIVDTDAGFAFARGLVRDAVAARARSAGRWTDHHRILAEVVGRRKTEPDRLGRHLVAAGAAALAHAPLLEGITRARRQHAVRRALALVAVAERALQSAPADEPHRVALKLHRAALGLRVGEHDEARRLAASVRASTRDQGRLAWAHREAGRVLAALAARRWDLEQLRELLDAVAPQVHAARVPAERARLAVLRAFASWLSGDRARADHTLQAAVAAWIRAETPGRAAAAAACHARVTLEAGDVTTALARLDDVLERLPLREALPRAACNTVRGEALWSLGSAADAEAAWEQALVDWAEAGCPARGTSALTGLALARLARRSPDARWFLERAWRAAERVDDRSSLAVIHLALAASLAEEQAWARVTHHLERGIAAVTETGRCDRVVARLAEAAGVAAEDRDEARQAYGLALLQWRQLGDTTRAARVERRLQR